MSHFVHEVQLSQIGGLKKSDKSKKSKKSKIDKSIKINSVLDLYDVKKITESEFNKVVDKSPKDVKDTISGVLKLSAELRKFGKLVEIIPLPLSDGGVYWGDYAKDYISEKHGNNWYSNYMFFTIYMNHDGNMIEPDQGIRVTYSDMDKKSKIQLLDLLDKYLSGRYEWRGSNTESIFIKYKKEKQIKVDRTKLKDDDIYPFIIIHIDFEKTIRLFDNYDIIQTVLAELRRIAKVEFSNYGYGMHDMDVELYSVDHNKHIELEKKIGKYLTKLKNVNIVTKYFTRYIQKK